MEINQIDTRTQIHLLYLCATDIELLEVTARREVYLSQRREDKEQQLQLRKRREVNGCEFRIAYLHTLQMMAAVHLQPS